MAHLYHNRSGALEKSNNLFVDVKEIFEELVVSSNEGSRTICHRPLQKIVPLEIVGSLEPETVAREERPKRKAAAEGQMQRRLRETFG